MRNAKVDASVYALLVPSMAVMLVGCLSGNRTVQMGPSWSRDVCRSVRVVDEQGRPVAGARAHAIVQERTCGPSGLPEACGGPAIVDGPLKSTGTDGRADLCYAETDRTRDASFVVERDGWPSATFAFGTDAVIGPARSATVEVPAACPDTRVYAYGERGVPILATRAGSTFTFAGLGPWSYWIKTESKTCPAYVRALDGRDPTTVVTLDRSDARIELPDFANATVTIARFRETEAVATAKLDDAGSATIALPATSGSAFCMRVAIDDRVLVTYARAGELTRPGMYSDRDLAGTCSALE